MSKDPIFICDVCDNVRSVYDMSQENNVCDDCYKEREAWADDPFDSQYENAKDTDWLRRTGRI